MTRIKLVLEIVFQSNLQITNPLPEIPEEDLAYLIYIFILLLVYIFL